MSKKSASSWSGNQQIRNVSKNHPSKNLDWSSRRWQICVPLSPSRAFSLTACPRCSTLCGWPSLFGCDQHRTCPTRDLEEERVFRNNKACRDEAHCDTFLPIILRRISGGSWGFWESSPLIVFLRPCTEWVAKVSLSKMIISRAEVYFL